MNSIAYLAALICSHRFQLFSSISTNAGQLVAGVHPRDMNRVPDAASYVSATPLVGDGAAVLVDSTTAASDVAAALNSVPALSSLYGKSYFSAFGLHQNVFFHGMYFVLYK